MKREKVIKKNELVVQCTIEDFVNYILDKIEKEEVENYEFDFALVDDNEDFSTDLEDLLINSSGWYGVHTINTNFDNDEDIVLCADYWGGQYPQFASYIYGFDPYESFKSELLKAVLETLSLEYRTIDKDAIIVGHIHKR